MHKTCAVTRTGKRPPNRDPELQWTELVHDVKALMVQDTETGDKDGIRTQAGITQEEEVLLR